MLFVVCLLWWKSCFHVANRLLNFKSYLHIAVNSLFYSSCYKELMLKIIAISPRCTLRPIHLQHQTIISIRYTSPHGILFAIGVGVHKSPCSMVSLYFYVLSMMLQQQFRRNLSCGGFTWKQRWALDTGTQVPQVPGIYQRAAEVDLI